MQADLSVISANEAFYRTFRTSSEETESRSLFELGSRQWDNPKLRGLLQDVLKRDDSFESLEVKYDFPTIGPRIMLLHGHRLRTRGLDSDLILLAVEDVTEARQGELALQASETRYRRLFETARDGILILDSTTGQIIDANPFMIEMLGYSHSDLCGKQLWQIGLFKDIDANRVVFTELQTRGYVRYHNLPLQTRTGQSIEVEFVSNVYRESFGTVIQCNIRDHTEHTQLERHSRAQAAALADMYRRKDEFLAMLSHELRNPLSAIANGVQVLRLERSNSPVQRQARDIVERQTGQLANLVEDLLEVSRIATGKLQLRLRLMDVRDIVARAVEVIQPLVVARKHRLKVSLPTEPVVGAGRSDTLGASGRQSAPQCREIHDEEGAIWLTLELEAKEMVLRVRDTGIGIPPETLPLVFKLFVQAEQPPDRAHDGLGVGLTLVQKLVEMHGGTVEAISAGPGQGSEFAVRLPIEPAKRSSERR
jgi:PAS domain S-box-containing protein